MRKIFSGLVAVAAALSITPATAQQSDNPQKDSIVVTAQRYENKVVCKYQAAVGTRIPTRNCMTNKEWDDLRESTIRYAHELIDSPKINCPGC